MQVDDHAGAIDGWQIGRIFGASTKEHVMFTVFGATGNTGSTIANLLLDQGKRVRAVVHDPKKADALKARGAELVTGDVTDRATVVAALAGAQGAYLIVPPDNTSQDL